MLSGRREILKQITSYRKLYDKFEYNVVQVCWKYYLRHYLFKSILEETQRNKN